MQDEEAGPPEPISATQSAEASQARIVYENEINAAAEQFGAEARDTYTTAKLNGHMVGIVVTDTEGEVVEPPEPPVVIAEPAPPVSSEADDVEVAAPYSEWTKEELSEELGNRGLAVSGNKDELVERLYEDDESPAE